MTDGNKCTRYAQFCKGAWWRSDADFLFLSVFPQTPNDRRMLLYFEVNE